jgi:hypothetical protein
VKPGRLHFLKIILQRALGVSGPWLDVSASALCLTLESAFPDVFQTNSYSRVHVTTLNAFQIPES